MIKGSIVDLVTPTQADGVVDFEAVEALVDWHVEQGSVALLVGSATGQSAAQKLDERAELFRRAVWQAEGRIPVMADISAATTADTLECAAAADEAGVDAVLLSAPVAAWPAPDELLSHFQTVAEASRRPLIVRDCADRPHLSSSAFVARLTRIKGMTGFVDRGANSAGARELLALELPEGFALYAGADASACGLMLDGFHGVVSVTANVAPALVQTMCAAALNGDRDSAEALDVRLQPLHQALMANVDAVFVKWALTEMGCLAEGTAPPTLPRPIDYSNLRRALRAARVLS